MRDKREDIQFTLLENIVIMCLCELSVYIYVCVCSYFHFHGNRQTHPHGSSSSLPLHKHSRTRERQRNLFSVIPQTSHLRGVFQSSQSGTRAISGRLSWGGADSNSVIDRLKRFEICRFIHLIFGGIDSRGEEWWDEFVRSQQSPLWVAWLWLSLSLFYIYFHNSNLIFPQSLCVIRLICPYCIM